MDVREVEEVNLPLHAGLACAWVLIIKSLHYKVMVQVTTSLGCLFSCIVVECRVRQVNWGIMSEPCGLRVRLVTNIKILGKVLMMVIIMGTVIINDVVVLIHELTVLVDSYFLANIA
jgi:hypothetical protein